MATPKQIRQRIGWALAQRGNVNEALAKMDAHLNQAATDLDEYVEDPVDPVEPPADEPEEPVEPEPLPGTTEPPTFSVLDGKLRIDWPEAEGATFYRVTRAGAEPFDVTGNHAIVPMMQDGEWLCVEPRNATGAAESSCNEYQAADTPPAEPEPEPDPLPDPDPDPDPAPEPPTGDWTKVHEFSPATGEDIPSGVVFSIKDTSWSGRAEHTSDGYLMTYTAGMRDGVGPGRIGIEAGAVPQGHRSAMCEYDVTLSSDFEDHVVFNKIAHYRMKPNPDGSGSKFIDKWKNYRLGYGTSSATATRLGKHLGDFYPDDNGGYNSVVGNVRRDRFVAEQKHTVRCEWTWLRTDSGDSDINWYRLRWWLDGVLQGDFPEVPLLGGPEFYYWEIAPTWGGSAGHIKQKDDWMLISRVATWVR